MDWTESREMTRDKNSASNPQNSAVFISTNLYLGGLRENLRITADKWVCKLKRGLGVTDRRHNGIWKPVTKSEIPKRKP